jgi:hypothetical protein
MYISLHHYMCSNFSVRFVNSGKCTTWNNCGGMFNWTGFSVWGKVDASRYNVFCGVVLKCGI